MLNSEIAVSVNNLGRKFKKAWALRDISLEIGKGELFGLVGPDGAGKTTFIQSLCAILDPTEGSASVGGLDTVRDAALITSQIGYMSQAYSLYEDLTVAENLEFFAEIRAVPRDQFIARRKRLLEFSGLLPFLTRRTRYLSGGMQKKLALCCNLIHEPDILVLDEPTLGVDPVSRRLLWTIISDYHRQGKTIIVATSYMDEAARCNRVAFLLEGKLLACDAPAALGGKLEDVFFAHIHKDRVQPVAPFSTRSRDGMAVQVDELVKRFDSFTAVNGISFSVRYGEIFGFVGPNGSGKTTTIKILCGILPPTTGRVWVAGTSVNERPEAAKRRIGYMSQKFSLYLDLTVRENLEFFGGVYGLDRDLFQARKTWILEMADLVGREDALAGNISGALRQRLALGCALLHNPDVVFLDEPTSGVDPVSRQAFWQMIRMIADAGTTVFVTTHYLEEAEHCNRVAFLHRGKLLAIEEPARLMAASQKPMEEIFVRMVERSEAGERLAGT